MKKTMCQRCPQEIDKSAGGFAIITYKDKASSPQLKDTKFYLCGDCYFQVMSDEDVICPH